MQTAGFQYLVVTQLPFSTQRGHALLARRRIQAFIGQHAVDFRLGVAAEHDIRAAARHVGGNGDDLRPAGLGDDLGFARMLLGIEHVVRQLLFLQHAGDVLGVLDRGRADEHWLAALVAAANVIDDRLVFFPRRAEDLVHAVIADHRMMRRDDHRLQPVNLLELVGFGIRSASHAGKLAVHAEVVLEGNRGERLVFLLDLHAFLGFNRLMQPFRPATARHQPPGELIDNDDLVVLHDILLVAVEQAVRPQRRIQMMHQRDIGGVVEATALRQHARLRQQRFGALVSVLGEDDLVALLVDPVITRVFFILLPHQLRRHDIHAHVEIGGVLRLTGNDQRCARLVDQDRIDLVDDGVGQPALHFFGQLVDHVVAQVIEAEFVVGAVGNVGAVGFLLERVLHLRQVDAHAEAEETVNAAHPVGIALRQIVVDGHDVHAGAGERIEVSRQCRHQGLALAGTHFRNLAAMQRKAADQLHIEMTHAHYALAGFANYGKSFGEQRIQRCTATAVDIG